MKAAIKSKTIQVKFFFKVQKVTFDYIDNIAKLTQGVLSPEIY